MEMEKSGQAIEKRHWIRITRACNNRCVFCLDRETLDGTILPVEDVSAELRRGLDIGAARAIISGGEPTIHPAFSEIISAARGMGYGWVQAISNGRMFYYRDFLDRAVSAGLNEITFSMHAHTRELFDEIVGAPGAFKQAVTGLANALRTPGLVVSVDIVLSGMNAPHLVDMINFYRRMGVREFDLLYPVPFGAAWANMSRVALEPGAIAEQLKRILAMRENRAVTFWTNRFPVEHLEGVESLIQSPEKIFDEVYGRREMFLDFLERGVPLACRGERCSLCNMSVFCDALINLKDTICAESAQEWLVTPETADLLEQVPPERFAAIILDPAELIEHPVVKRLVTRGAAAVLVHHSPPADGVFPMEHESELAINRITAPFILKEGNSSVTGHGAILSLRNRRKLEDCLKEDVSLKVFFKHFAGAWPGGFRNVPPCLSGADAFPPLRGIPLDVIPVDGKWNLEAVARYFLVHANYRKSLRCRGCAHYSSCPGLHINYIRAFGFAEIPGPCASTEARPSLTPREIP